MMMNDLMAQYPTLDPTRFSAKKSIAVVGAGYVGLSASVLLSQRHHVTVIDIVPEKVRMINERRSTVSDSLIEQFFREAGERKRDLDLYATTDSSEAFSYADFILVCVPTDLNPAFYSFDCSVVDNVMYSIMKSIGNRKKKPLIIIKSTVPVGYTETLKKRFHIDSVICCPEFLRESNALYDNLYPSRVVIGADMRDQASASATKAFAQILSECLEKTNVEFVYMTPSEAESVKLFSNAYLSMRVAFFNELDMFAESNHLDSASIIKGVGLDSRIGEYYNNPSFGYGGYCLPKDTAQLRTHFRSLSIPGVLANAVIESNHIRKAYIVSKIESLLSHFSVFNDKAEMDISKASVGIYRLSMKRDSDDFRASPVLDIIDMLKKKGIRVIIYEPELNERGIYHGCEMISSLPEFKRISDLIIANRFDKELEDVRLKVYTRDIFGRD